MADTGALVILVTRGLLSDTVLDNFPNQLTEFAKHLCLIDTAFFVNSSYPPLLRPERKADLIIHLNYCAGSQTKASAASRAPPEPRGPGSSAKPQSPPHFVNK